MALPLQRPAPILCAVFTLLLLLFVNTTSLHAGPSLPTGPSETRAQLLAQAEEPPHADSPTTGLNSVEVPLSAVTLPDVAPWGLFDLMVALLGVLGAIFLTARALACRRKLRRLPVLFGVLTGLLPTLMLLRWEQLTVMVLFTRFTPAFAIAALLHGGTVLWAYLTREKPAKPYLARKQP